MYKPDGHPGFVCKYKQTEMLWKSQIEQMFVLKWFI